MSSEIKNLLEELKKQHVKIDSVVRSTITIKNQRKGMNKKQINIENSIKQFPCELKIMQTQLKAEQQKKYYFENQTYI